METPTSKNKETHSIHSVRSMEYERKSNLNLSLFFFANKKYYYYLSLHWFFSNEKNCTINMSSSRKNCLNLTKELKQYLAKKDAEIRKQLNDGPPSSDDVVPTKPDKLISLINYLVFCIPKFDFIFNKFFLVFSCFIHVHLQLSSTEMPRHCKSNIDNNCIAAFLLVTTDYWPCIWHHWSYNCKLFSIEYNYESENLLLKEIAQ